MNQTGERLEGIGGWLILVALGVIASPFLLLSASIELIEAHRLLLASDQNSKTITFLVNVEMFGNGAFLLWACFNIYLFFNKKIAFKNSYVFFLCSNFLFITFDLIAVELFANLPVTADEVGQIAGRLPAMIIWSSYIYRSERVRNTFTHGSNDRKFWKVLVFSLISFGFLCVIGLQMLQFSRPIIDEQMLQIFAQNDSDQYGGQMIDEETRFDRTEATGTKYTIYYTLVNGAANEWESIEVVNFVRPNLLDTSCSEYGDWLKAGVTLQYRYSGNDGLPVATLDFTANDCPGLVELGSDGDPSVTAREIAANAKSSFVSIRGYVEGELATNGSGFVVRQDGVLVTNLHVLQGIDAVKVQLPNDEIYERVFVLSVDEARDLVLLQIPATGLSALQIGNDRAVEVGDTIYTLGNPLGLEQTFSDGVLSAKRVTDGIEYFQISAPISPGSSGGPVLNDSGHIIGVATSFMPDGQNLNIAMPSRYVSGMLAVSNERKTFEELAGSGAFAATDTLTSRNMQTTSLLERYPEEFRASINELEPWEQQVLIRALAMGHIFEEDGWEEIEQNFPLGYLKSGEHETINVVLKAGEYAAFAVCDNDCTDLDLGVLVEDDEPLTDQELDAEPIVSFNLPESAAVRIVALMQTCASEDCAFWVQLYRKQ